MIVSSAVASVENFTLNCPLRRDSQKTVSLESFLCIYIMLFILVLINSLSSNHA